MPGLVPGIHALNPQQVKDVDGRDKPGHDDVDGSEPETAGIIRMFGWEAGGHARN